MNVMNALSINWVPLFLSALAAVPAVAAYPLRGYNPGYFLVMAVWPQYETIVRFGMIGFGIVAVTVAGTFLWANWNRSPEKPHQRTI